MTDLSEEMQEALRILREDGQIGAYNRMTESNQKLVQRLDEIETKNSERDAQWEERFKSAGKGEETPPADGGTPGSGEGGGGTGEAPGAPGGVPTPPPVNEPVPPEEKPAGRKRWYESDVYRKGD